MIRKAALRDIDEAEKIYKELFEYERKHRAYTVWKEGVYPTRKTVENAIAEGSLYLLEKEGEICGSIIANGNQPEEYGKIEWKSKAAAEEVSVIHLLCVKPSKAGEGIGKALVRFVINEGKRLGLKAVRLDTGAQNTPAAALYKKLGFELAGTTSMAIGGVIAHDNHLFFEKNTVKARNRKCVLNTAPFAEGSLLKRK